MFTFASAQRRNGFRAMRGAAKRARRARSVLKVITLSHGVAEKDTSAARGQQSRNSASRPTRLFSETDGKWREICR